MAGSYESDANNNHVANRVDAANSGTSDTATVPSTTYLGHRPVPIISSCQGMIDAIEKFKGDIPFTSEIVRKSTIDYTCGQLILIRDVLEAEVIFSKYGFDQQFYDAVIRFEESMELRVDEEIAFFAQQKSLYLRIYEILRQSSFPYSARQAACLHKILEVLREATGHPSSEGDKQILTSLQELVRLMELNDHLKDSTPHRVIVMGTIPYYLQNMLRRLDQLAREEGGRPHPNFIHPDYTIDLATYLVVNFDVMAIKDKELTPREHFHYGMVEIYTKFVEIFTHSGLEFSTRQQAVIQMIERRIRDLKKDPLMSKHHGIGEACLEFMSELEENNPDREVTLENGQVVWAANGTVNKAVREISWWLVNLQHATTNHLINFPSFGNGVENVIAKAMERFLALYPMH